MTKLMRGIRNSAIWILFLLIALLIPKPKRKKKILDVDSVEKLLREALGEKCILFLVDQKYRIPTLESFKKFLQEDKTDLYKYIAEFYDCDDFSFRLMGQFSVPGWSDITFGIATSFIHAYNCLIAEDEDEDEMKVYLIEPQNDKIQLAKEMMEKEYETIFVMM